MKKLISLIFATSLTLSACGTASTQPAPPTQTRPPTATLTATQTPTSTITPLPIIPTFTPTFDVSTIVTVTPAEKAECPKINPMLIPNLGFEKILACMSNAKVNHQDTLRCANKNSHNNILEYLNSGGDINKVISQLNAISAEKNSLYVYTDLTGDSIPEFLFHDPFRYYGGYYFYTCNKGIYTINLDFLSGDEGVIIQSIQDINLDGKREVIFKIQNVLIIIGWENNKFAEILGIRDFGESRYQIFDLENDGVMEIIYSRGYPPYADERLELPWRHYTSIYAWNGTSYVLKSKEFQYPQYRFQAIQDADNYVNNGINEQAYSYYQGAIFNKKLEWWTPERREFLISTLQNPNPPTPPSSLLPDLAEYPRLAAYAYYRILLLHRAQGQEAEAASTYQTLQGTFGTDPYAVPYVEMATAFWESYQSTQSMYDGCAAAIQYAVEHPEILIPLGSDYHGWQSHDYEPADVCPFR